MTGSWRVIGLVAGREVRQRSRSRAFVVITAIFAVAVTALAAIPGLAGDLAAPAEQNAPRVGIVGTDAQGLDPTYRAALASLSEPPPELVALPDEAAAAAALERGEVAFAFDPGGPRVLAVAASGPFSTTVPREITDVLSLAIAARTAELDGEVVAQLVDPEPITVRVVASGAGVDPDDTGTRFAVAYVGAVLLYFFLIFTANLVVTGVVEEKGSRIVELLLPAVSARGLMGGKVLGLGLVGTLQAAVIVLPGVTVLALTGGGPPPGELVTAGASVLVAFVLGFGLYAGVTAGLSALVSRIEDSQVALLPLYAILILAFAVTFPVLGQPGSGLAQVVTFVPFTAPFVVPARMVLVEVPWWHVAVSAAGVVGTAVVLTAVAARLYEGAILRGGARVRVREALSDDRR